MASPKIGDLFGSLGLWCLFLSGFQSIGVTKDWRPKTVPPRSPCPPSHFQSIGVTKDWRLIVMSLITAEPITVLLTIFPINRRHQGLATGPNSEFNGTSAHPFPINRRHQGLATHGFSQNNQAWRFQFSINRRHQGLATFLSRFFSWLLMLCFQSICVTKDWRPGICLAPQINRGFQFPINRRHQGLATYSRGRADERAAIARVSNQ